MCLVVVAINAHPRYRLVLAANRDEYHARPATPAAWGNDGEFDGILAGRDLAAGGTWLGVRRDGAFALVTNVRDGRPQDPAAPSRGGLVPRVLGDGLASLAQDAPRYNGFNLLAGDASSLTWISNRTGAHRTIEQGVHGLSNAALDVPWPKVVRTEQRMRQWIEGATVDIESLLAALADRERAPDEQLPATGVPLEWERILSAPFIVTERYGTRCSTVYAVDADGRAMFCERSFAPDGSVTGEVRERFTLRR